MNKRWYWQLEPDLRGILPRVWKTWELYREDLAEISALAEEARRFTGLEPEFVAEDAQGNPIDRLRLSPESGALLKRLNPVVRAPFEGRGWPYFFTATYLLANPGLNHLLSSTAGILLLLSKYAPELGGPKSQLQSGAVWGAQWLASPSSSYARDEAWRLNGQHDPALGIGLSDYALVIGQHGAEEESLFLLPRRNRRGQLNYRTQLKPQPAAMGLPSGSVEMEGAEAYLVGKVEEGQQYMAELSTLNHLAQAMCWTGLGRHVQLEVLRIAPLEPASCYELTDWAVRLAGGLALSLRAVATWDKTRQEYPPYENAYLARFLSYIAKVRAREHTLVVAQSASRVLGGLALAQNPALARLIQEAQSVPLWQKPAHLELAEAVEWLRHRRIEGPFRADFGSRLQRAHHPEATTAAEILSQTLDLLLGLKPAEAHWRASSALRTLADAATVALLYDLSPEGERYAELAGLYARHFLGGEPYPGRVLNQPDLWGKTASSSE